LSATSHPFPPPSPTPSTPRTTFLLLIRSPQPRAAINTCPIQPRRSRPPALDGRTG
jgi:hypothetical protein